MAEFITKYCRGSVWFLDDDHLNHPIGDEMRKSRPWLIVSCNRNNYNSTILTCVPITTGSSTRDYQETYTYRGRPQVIHCESPSSKSIERFELAGSHYMYQLPSDMMERVDKCLRLHFYLDTPSFSYMLKDVEEIIDRVLQKKQMEKEQVVTDEFINTIAKKIEDMVLPPEKVEIAPIIPELTVQESVDVTVVEQEPIIERPQNHNRWTRPRAEEYILYMKHHTAEETAEKYNLKSAKSALQTKYLLKKKYYKEES